MLLQWRRNHGGSGGWRPLYFLLDLTCLARWKRETLGQAGAFTWQGTYSRAIAYVNSVRIVRAHAHIQNSGWRPPIVDHLPTPLSCSSKFIISRDPEGIGIHTETHK